MRVSRPPRRVTRVLAQTLEVLDLSFNRLSGTLPDVFGSASRLKELLLSNNALSVRCAAAACWPRPALSLSCGQGAAPRTLGLLRDGVCTAIDLSFNELRGAVPSGLARVTSLTTLDLSYNRFTAIAPATFAGLVNVRCVSLSRSNAHTHARTP